MADTQVLPGWKELADSINTLKGMVVILGAPDTGKTTISFYLSRELQLKGCKVAMISADIGQSVFGPPATLSMALLDTVTTQYRVQVDQLSLKEIRIHSMYFIGSTSPVRHLLQTTVGLKRLVEKAQGEGTEVVIIDTSGFIEGGAAWELKFQEIELVNARHIVALQRSKELEDILSPHMHRKCRTLYRLKICAGIRLRSYEQRREYRRKRFSEYFLGATTRGIPLETVKLINPLNTSAVRSSGGLYKGVLVGLNDDENFTLGLGIIENMDNKELQLQTPVEELKEIKIVRFGSIRLDGNLYDSWVRPSV